MSIQAINVRNQFRGQIKEIIRGDVLSEIDVETPAGIVTSVITTRSVDHLGLKVGSDILLDSEVPDRKMRGPTTVPSLTASRSAWIE